MSHVYYSYIEISPPTVILVISPLKSFMPNQKYIWCKAGVKCAQLFSDRNAGENEQQANSNGKNFIHK